MIEIVHNTSPKTQTFTIKGSFRDSSVIVGPYQSVIVGPYQSVIVGPYQSGIFEDPTLPGPGDADLNLKNACFYVDLDEADRRPKFLIPAVISLTTRMAGGLSPSPKNHKVQLVLIMKMVQHSQRCQMEGQ